MYKIVLINMPFGSLSLPSIGLTQIKSVLDASFKGQVETEVRYLSHDFAHYLGLDLYTAIAGSMEHHNSGMGDWLFRQAAFPSADDNADDYFGRYYPYPTKEVAAFKSTIQEKRAGLNDFLDELVTRHALDQAQMVGFTSMFMQNVASFAMARKVKERSPGVLAVMGGANCEFPMGQEIVRHVEHLDYVFSGPGLKSFPAFVRTRLEHDEEAAGRISGVFSRATPDTRQAPPNPHQPSAAGAPLSQAPVTLGRTATAVATLPVLSAPAAVGTYGEELDINHEVPLDYDAFLDALEGNFPNKQVEPVLLFETSRGCWWGEKAHCTFCGLNGASMNYRAMEVDKAFKLFKDLFEYSDRCVRYNCVDNIMAKNYLTEVFPHLDTPQHVHMFYEVKADLSQEDLQALSRARVKIIQPGVESLATSTLKLMKKGTSAFQNVMLLKNCLIYDVCPEWNLLVGFPGEGDEVYQKYVKDLPLLMHLPPPSGVFPVRFDRYSPYFVKAKEYELDLHPVDFYELTYPFDKESLGNLAYYFADGNLRAKYFLTVLKWIGKVREKHSVWSKRWHEEGAEYPQLFLKREGDANLVHDTRPGELVEHVLSDVSVKILELMSKPQRLSNLNAEFGHLPGFDAEAEVALLQEKGLLFQEHDRYLSLVLPRELPRLSFTP
ncbi:MAG: hypothetical protein QOJ70_2340 [Acidobacteriota bacterium]|jgi:magnesium-protoporphyrin IX monomethyl ester (oxidative) cyclase|nr:hypothetical protein [Acidobacteriota bacterium]